MSGGRWSSTWHGPALEKTMRDAEARATEKTLDEAVAYAKANHTWHDDTGEARRSIARGTVDRQGAGVRGDFGSTLARFIWLEIGSRGRAGDNTIRRASDATFPKIGTNLQRMLAEGGDHTKLPGRAASDTADAAAGRVPTGGDVSTS